MNMVRKNAVRIVLGIVIISLLCGCSGMFAESLIYANRQPLIKTPDQYGMQYRDIEFKTSDNLRLKGWVIPGNRSSVAVMVHPMNFSKYGYSIQNQGTFKITDIEVEFLNTAKSLNDAGHTVLTFDLRNHGESQNSPDSIFGLGTLEWKDVVGALDYIENDTELRDKQVFFVSFCTGANATILAMKNRPEKFKKVKCMAAVQPISMEVFVTNFLADKYPLFKGMVPGIEKSMIKKGGLPYNKMSPLNYVDGLFLPVLCVQAESDKWTDTEYVQNIYDEISSPKEMLWLKGDMHRFDTYNYFGHTPHELLNYVNKFVD